MVARIRSIDPSAVSRDRATNHKPTKAKPQQEKGVTIASRLFVASAQLTKEESKSQTELFKLESAMAGCLVDCEALLAEREAHFRAKAEAEKAQEAMTAAKAGKEATVSAVKALAAKATAKAGVPA